MTRAPGLAIAGVVLCGLAAGFAAPALYVPGLGLLLLAGVATVWVTLAARRVRVVRDVPRTTLVEGERLLLGVTVTRGRLPLPGGELRFVPNGAPVPVRRLPRRGASRTPSWTQTTEAAVSAIVPRRGRHTLGPARLRISDPLHICERVARSAATEVLVLPRVEEVGFAALRAISGAGPRRGQSASHGPIAHAGGLRPYRPGSPASHIHWPTVARTGTLMEHRLAARGSGQVLVILDARRPVSEEALDRTLRACASLCVHLAARGGCAVLLPGDRRISLIEPDLRAWPALHIRLALVEAGGASPRQALLTHAERIVWVTASASGPPAGVASLSSAGGYVVSPQPLRGPPISFTVAGCCGQPLRATRMARA